jgi:sugar phosphate isomerase/epimerase
MYRELATGPIGVNVPFEEAARLARAHGFQALSLSVGVIQEHSAAKVRDILAANGLRAGTSGVPVNFRGDDATFEEGLAELPTGAALLQAVGCTRVLTWFMPFHDTLPYEDNFRQLASRSGRIARVLGDHGIRYGLEFVGPATLRAGKAHPFIYDIDGLLRLIDAIDADNVGFLLDAFHWYTSGGTRADLEKLSDDLIVGVHVNDGYAGRSAEEQIDQERAMPGETGVIDIGTFMRALDAMGYSGPVIVEPFSQRIRSLPPDEAVAETAASLDKIWQIAGL